MMAADVPMASTEARRGTEPVRYPWANTAWSAIWTGRKALRAASLPRSAATAIATVLTPNRRHPNSAAPVTSRRGTPKTRC